MSGHCKWNNIKRKKEKTDGAKAKVFTKIGREISVAVRTGGPNPASNSKLADLIAKAKRMSVPNDNIQRIIKKAEGGDKTEFEAITYEGYGPGGVAVMVETLTDNRNRTAADVRSAFSHAGGNLGTSGSVAFQFERKGQIVVAKEILDENAKKETMIANGAAGDEDEFMMAIAEAGGEDYEDAGEEWIVWTTANEVMAVSKALEEQGVQVKGSETTMVPTTPTEVSGADAKKVQRLIDRLEELDDVQDVYSTMDMTDEVIAALEEE